MQQAGNYCIEYVKKHDYENFVATLLLPRHYLTHAIALRAFNVELAQVGSQTSEPLAGLMRLQFWREELDCMYDGRAKEQPVATLLGQTLKYTSLSQRWLRSLIDSREHMLHKKRFSSIEDIETYAEQSNSCLYYLILQAGGFQSAEADHAASHLGKAEGLLKVVRGVAPLAKAGTVMLPMALLAEKGVTDEQVLRGESSQAMSDVIYELACAAHQHLDHARSLAAGFPFAQLAPLLPTVTVGRHLSRLQSADFDIYARRFTRRDGLLAGRLWWALMRERI